jgi:serine protease AprX
MLSQRPQLSPDQVRDVLRRTARSLHGVSDDAQGEGAIDLATAQDLANRMRPGRSANSRDSYRSWGNSRRSHDDDDWAGDVSDGAYWNGVKWSGATWAGATWAGATWASDGWDGATWAGATWAGATWAGATWAGATWAGATWADADWASAGWE